MQFIFMKHIFKFPIIFIMLCCLLGCSVQGTYYYSHGYNKYYHSESKIVLGPQNKGYVAIGDTTVYNFTYKELMRWRRYRRATEHILVFEFEKNDSLKLENPNEVSITRHRLKLSDIDRWTLTFVKDSSSK